MSFLLNDDKPLDISNWYYFEKGFTQEELDAIEKLQEEFTYQDGVLASPNNDLESYRKSQIKWLRANHPETPWIYQKFAHMATEANKAIWDFQLTGMLEDLQYTHYPAGGGHYDWHMDVGPGAPSKRKISIVLQLSDPSEYEGGVFELFINKDVIQLPRIKGSVLLFPSYFMHRVTPVTEGSRKSLVLWVSGPTFR